MTSVTSLNLQHLDYPKALSFSEEALYQKYLAICQKKNASPSLTSVDVESLIKAAEKAKAGSLHVFSKPTTGPLGFAGRLKSGEMVIGLQDKDSLKHQETFRTVFYTLLGTDQKIAGKLIKKPFEEDLLRERDFLNHLSKSLLGLQEPILGSLIRGDKQIGFVMNSSEMAIYQKKLFHLIKAANQVEKRTFTVFTDCLSSTQEKFFVGKSKEDQIQIGRINPKSIGKGAFGEVFSVSLPLGKIAIKLAFDGFYEDSLQNEIEILASLHEDTDLDIIGIQPSPLGHSCRKTLSMVSSFSVSSQIGLSMELFEGSYKDYINAVTKHSIPSPPFQTILTHLSQLASGLAFLQERKILHADIKRANVLKEGNTVKISDFGSAKNTSIGENPDPENYPYSITPLKNIKELEKIDYTDSEQRVRAIQIALGMDRYQLGELFWSIWNWTASEYTKYHPPYNFEEFQINDEIREYPKHFYPDFNTKEKTYTPRKFSPKVKIPDNVGDFVRQMVDVDEAARPSMKEIEDSFNLFGVK